MTFPYVNLLDGSSMPVIPVTLGRGDRYVVTEALIDSGSANGIFDAQFAKALGISSLHSGTKRIFEGISGHRIAGYQHSVNLIVGGKRIPHVMIAFSEDMPDNSVNILGQQGFFELFPITFNYRKKEITIAL